MDCSSWLPIHDILNSLIATLSLLLLSNIAQTAPGMHVMHTHAHVLQEELALPDVAATDLNGGLVDERRRTARWDFTPTPVQA